MNVGCRSNTCCPGGVEQIEAEEEEEEVISDVVRNRATSDVTNNSTAKYQYLMKV